jgi:hypothetical protein
MRRLNYRIQQIVYYWAERKESQSLNISVFFEVQNFCWGVGIWPCRSGRQSPSYTNNDSKKSVRDHFINTATKISNFLTATWL